MAFLVSYGLEDNEAAKRDKPYSKFGNQELLKMAHHLEDEDANCLIDSPQGQSKFDAAIDKSSMDEAIILK